MVDHGAILVVDPNAGFRAFVSELFVRAGFEVVESERGEHALALARRDRPALVLLDVRLPDVNGFEVCQRLRDEFGDDLPVIFVSGDRTDPLDRAAGLLVGGDDYVTKPVDPDELLARVRRLITRVRSRHELPAPLANGMLTRREYEVLELLSGGLGTKAIASKLVVSPKTVASHIQHILAKLGAHSRAEAVAIAYRNELVLRQTVTAGDDDVRAHMSVAAPASSAEGGVTSRRSLALLQQKPVDAA